MITIAKLGKGAARHSWKRKEGNERKRPPPLPLLLLLLLDAGTRLLHTVANRTTRIFCNADDGGRTISPRLCPSPRGRESVINSLPTRTYLPASRPRKLEETRGQRGIGFQRSTSSRPDSRQDQEIPPMGGEERRKLPARLIHFDILQPGRRGGATGIIKVLGKLYQFNGFAACIRGGGGEKSFHSPRLPSTAALSITPSRAGCALCTQTDRRFSRPTVFNSQLIRPSVSRYSPPLYYLVI